MTARAGLMSPLFIDKQRRVSPSRIDMEMFALSVANHV